VLLRDPEVAVRHSAHAALEHLKKNPPLHLHPEALRGLAASLGDPKAEVRRTAAQAVGYLGGRAATSEIVHGLTLLLTDPAGEVREVGAQALGCLGEHAATPEVLAALPTLFCDETVEVRRTAAWAVSQLGDSATTPEIQVGLARLLADADWPTRSNALRALHQFGQFSATSDFLNDLVGFLSRPEADMRYEAARMIAERGGDLTEGVRTALARLLCDGDPGVRWAAAEAVRQIGSPAATAEILGELHERLRDPSWDVRGVAAEALKRLLKEARVRLFRLPNEAGWCVCTIDELAGEEAS
jgi:HEAT repeat protein